MAQQQTHPFYLYHDGKVFNSVERLVSYVEMKNTIDNLKIYSTIYLQFQNLKDQIHQIEGLDNTSLIDQIKEVSSSLYLFTDSREQFIQVYDSYLNELANLKVPTNKPLLNHTLDLFRRDLENRTNAIDTFFEEIEKIPIDVANLKKKMNTLDDLKKIISNLDSRLESSKNQIHELKEETEIEMWEKLCNNLDSEIKKYGEMIEKIQKKNDDLAMKIYLLKKDLGIIVPTNDNINYYDTRDSNIDVDAKPDEEY